MAHYNLADDLLDYEISEESSGANECTVCTRLFFRNVFDQCTWYICFTVVCVDIRHIIQTNYLKHSHSWKELCTSPFWTALNCHRSLWSRNVFGAAQEKSGDWQRALKLFAEMEAKITPNVRTCPHSPKAVASVAHLVVLTRKCTTFQTMFSQKSSRNIPNSTEMCDASS